MWAPGAWETPSKCCSTLRLCSRIHSKTAQTMWITVSLLRCVKTGLGAKQGAEMAFPLDIIRKVNSITFQIPVEKTIFKYFKSWSVSLQVFWNLTVNTHLIPVLLTPYRFLSPTSQCWFFLITQSDKDGVEKQGFTQKTESLLRRITVLSSAEPRLKIDIWMHEYVFVHLYVCVACETTKEILRRGNRENTGKQAVGEQAQR